MSNFYFTCYIIYFFIAIFSFLYSFLLFLSAFFPWFLPICAPYSYAKAFSPMISISQRYSHMGKTFCNVTSWEDHWCNMHADVPATPECGGDVGGGDVGGWDGGWGGWGWAAFCSVYDLQKPVLNVCRVCSLFTLTTLPGVTSHSCFLYCTLTSWLSLANFVWIWSFLGWIGSV